MGHSAPFSMASVRCCSCLVAAAAVLLCMAPCLPSVGQQLLGMQWAGARRQVGMPTRTSGMLHCGPRCDPLLFINPVHHNLCCNSVYCLSNRRRQQPPQ